MPVEIELQNYRCFPAPGRVSFLVQRGLTAFVGPNNAGKSTVLKLFYELRDLFRQIGWAPIGFAQLSDQQQPGVQYPSKLDSQAIFSRSTTGPLLIQITLSDDAITRPQRVHNGVSVLPINRCRITVERSKPSHPRLELLHDGLYLDAKKGAAGPAEFAEFSNFPGTRFDVSDLATAITNLANTIYIGPFRNIVNVGAETFYFDLPIGNAFIAQWSAAQDGRIEQAKAVQAVVRDVEDIFGIDRLEIKANADRNRLLATVNDEPFDISELGSGLTQFLAALYVAKTKSPAFLLIDEPEANLHPSLQLDFLTRLASFTTDGLLFATHSVGLARSAAATVYSVCKASIKEPSTIRPFEALHNVATFLGELSYSGSYDLGFSKLLLVEGPTDIAVFEEFLKKLRVAHKVTILSIGGSDAMGRNAPKVLSQITQITSNVFALIDSERGSADKLPDDRKAFADACTELGIQCLLTERRCIESYFTQDAIGRAFPSGAPTALLPFSPVPSGWPKNDNWRIAAAMHWDELRSTDVGYFLQSLAVAPNMVPKTK